MTFNNPNYRVYRSRNNGQFWSLITPGLNLSLKEAEVIFDEEERKHPSDWLRIVREEVSSVRLYKGNKKVGVKSND